MIYVSTLAQLNELVAIGSKEPIIIGGELVFTSYERADMQSESISERYVAQRHRTASRRNLLEKSKRYLYLAIDRAATSMLTGYSGDVLIAADQYLAYGLQKSADGDVVILGGGERPESNGSFNVEGMVFTGQQLVRTFERKIYNAHDLDLNLEDITAEYPDHTLLWCDPLPPPPETELTRRRNFKIGGGEPLVNSIKRKIFVRAQGENEAWGIIPAVAVAALGFAVFAGTYAFQLQRVEAEKDEYRQAVRGYEQEYANSAHTLELLRHRDFVLTEESSSIGRVRLLNLLVNHVSAIRNATVNTVSVFDPDGDSRGQAVEGARNFLIELSVPQTTTARQQVKPILSALSNATGMTVQVIEHRDISSQDDSRWLYRLGGQVYVEQ